MRKFVISNNIVSNIIEADEGFTLPDALLVIADGVEADIGWLWNDGTPTPPAAPAPSPEDVWAEKDRRWAFGFDYDFGDGRGVHHIATTRKDLEDWDKVSAAASAFIALGQPGATITIYTETGPATVTALEWQSVLVAAAAFFQAAIDAGAALVAMDPIPADYADDGWWQ